MATKVPPLLRAWWIAGAIVALVIVAAAMQRRAERARRATTPQPTGPMSVAPSPSPSTPPAPPLVVPSAVTIVTDARTFSLRIATGNDTPEGEPNVWAHLPKTFDPKKPLALVVVFHGFSNCLRSFASEKGEVCRQFQSPRTGYDLVAQIEKSGTNAMVVVPQLAFDERSSDPGKLGEPGALASFLEELIGVALAQPLGHKHLADVARISMVALSGGYQALYPALTNGKLTAVRDVFLVDAYYFETNPVDDFVLGQLPKFRDHGAHRLRVGIIYSSNENTMLPSQAFAERVRLATLSDAGPPLLHRIDPTTLTIEDLRAPLAFIHSELEHDEIARVDLWKVLAATAP